MNKKNIIIAAIAVIAILLAVMIPVLKGGKSDENLGETIKIEDKLPEEDSAFENGEEETEDALPMIPVQEEEDKQESTVNKNPSKQEEQKQENNSENKENTDHSSTSNNSGNTGNTDSKEDTGNEEDTEIPDDDWDEEIQLPIIPIE